MMTETVLHSMAMPEAEDLTGDIWASLEEYLCRYDWYYAFSDDHRVWQAGEEARKQLIKILHKAMKVDEGRARKLFMQYAPPGCSVPT